MKARILQWLRQQESAALQGAETAEEAAKAAAEARARQLGIDASNFGPFGEPEALPCTHPARRALLRAEQKARLFQAARRLAERPS